MACCTQWALDMLLLVQILFILPGISVVLATQVVQLFLLGILGELFNMLCVRLKISD